MQSHNHRNEHCSERDIKPFLHPYTLVHVTLQKVSKVQLLKRSHVIFNTPYFKLKVEISTLGHLKTLSNFLK